MGAIESMIKDLTPNVIHKSQGVYSGYEYEYVIYIEWKNRHKMRKIDFLNANGDYGFFAVSVMFNDDRYYAIHFKTEEDALECWGDLFL